MRTGERPTLHVARSLEEEVATVAEQVRAWRRHWSEPRSIAVLYGSSYERGRHRAEMLYRALKELPGGVFWVVARQEDTKQDLKDRLPEAREPVVLSTIHSAKGLEFPCVVVCGIWRDDHDEGRNRMLAYVGMTRAREKLAVVAIEGHPLTQSLKDADAAGEAGDQAAAQRAAGWARRPPSPQRLRGRQRRDRAATRPGGCLRAGRAAGLVPLPGDASKLRAASGRNRPAI